jgi:integrase
MRERPAEADQRVIGRSLNHDRFRTTQSAATLKRSKNRKGRLLPLPGEPRSVIDRAREQRRLDCPFVFHREGRPIKDFRTAWNTACHGLGLGKLLVHNLRRTSVRNLVRAGISDKVAMN